MKTSTILALGIFVLIASLMYRWKLPAEDTAQSLNQPIAPANTHQILSEYAADPLPQKPAEPVAIPPLNIRLQGVMIYGRASTAIVLLLESNEQQHYKVGDFIQPGVRLHHIDANAIVIERDGRLEHIGMENSALSLNNGNSDAATDIPTLMTRARLELHGDGDQTDGFLISGIVAHSLYHTLGLHNGDIIRQINGTRLLNENQKMAFYEALSSSETIELEVMRAGHVKQLSYGTQ